MYSGLPVVDAHETVIGVVTEFDLLRAVREGKDLQTVKAEELMGQPPVCVEEEDDIDGSLIFPVEASIYSGISPALVQICDSLPDPDRAAERDGPG